MKKETYLTQNFIPGSIAFIMAIGATLSVASIDALAVTNDLGVFDMSAEYISAIEDVSEIGETQALVTSYDSEMNTYGPADYDFADDTMYLLNTASQMLYQYENGQLIKEFSLEEEDVFGIRISVSENRVFVLDNMFEVFEVSDGGLSSFGSIADSLEIDGVVGFSTDDEYLYVEEPTAEGGITHVYKEESASGELEEFGTIKGYQVGDGTYYQSQLIPEGDLNCGHKCTISIMDEIGAEVDTISLTSDFYIVGAQYLGLNSDGNYIVKVIEATEDGYITSETIRTIDRQNNYVSCVQLDEEVGSMQSQIKLIDGNVCYFDCDNAEASVVNIETEALPSYNTYVTGFNSSFENLNSDGNISVASADDSGVSTSGITRSNVMSNAKAYHSSFTWTCASKNLKALTNWTCPRYVSGAGSYSYMPYCWGGFSSTSQFKTAMNSSGRVGNINTSTSGRVSNTYGLDCSGYVSRCWGLTKKYATSTISNVSTQISYSNLKQGDAINKSGSHVVLYDYSDGSGNYILYECTKLNQYDRVSHTIRTISSLQSDSYVAIRYNGITG